jgi:peptidyl-prolyl cis-trans isomerase B (cyclophilin B)
VPSNQQRREAAKRKLQRQLVRREEIRARRRRTTMIAGTAAVILIAAGVVWLVTSSGKGTPTAAGTDTGASGSSDTAASSSGPSTPCTYTAGGSAAKPVKAPANTSPAKTGEVKAKISLNGETVDVALDRSLAPCSVNSFLSLASQGFYDGTSCHRLTKSAGLNVLQCGDPSGKGNGGPGYEYAPEVAQDASYKVGTLAMANTGPTGEGSQFFIVYGPTTVSPSYSIIGTVSEPGMKVVDAITAKGVKDNQQEGPPAAPAKIDSVTVPGDAVTATTSWPPTASSGAQGLPGSQAPIGSESGAGQSSSSGAPASQTPASGAPVSGTPVSKTNK